MMSRRLGNTVMTPTPRWFRPPLGEGYVGNGVTQRWTELTVQAVLSRSDAEVALALRSTLLGAAPHTWGNEAGWLAAKYKASLNKTRKCSPMDTCACVCVRVRVHVRKRKRVRSQRPSHIRVRLCKHATPTQTRPVRMVTMAVPN